MLISKNFLQDFIDLPKSVSDEKIAEALTLHTAEIEGFKHLGENLKHIVVGKIVEIKNHPDADKLKVCEVKISSGKTATIVCGGSNLKQDMKVAVALPGAKVRWHGQGELVDLKKTTIRGVASSGMICASSEIGLAHSFVAKHESEIMDISFINDPAGTTLKKALGLDDVVFEVDNKSITHRPDMWGHFGVARELSVLFKQPIKNKKTPAFKPARDGHVRPLRVQIKEKKLCPRYVGITIEGVEISKSPDWIQKRLQACGIRSINNIVDITNYVMLELGQPMHSFDAQTLNKEIIIRKAKNNEALSALDDNNYKLSSDDLVIADSKKPIAIAGIMGGIETSVTEKTTSVIFEAANFDAAAVRKSSVRLGVRSESSTRFEKSLDPNNCETAIKRAIELTLKLCPNAKVASNIADEKSFKLNQGPIEISIDFFEKKIGTKISEKEIVGILKRLGFDVKNVGANSIRPNDTIMSITVPTWRATKDITIPEDLVEEVARIYGYKNIEASLPKLDITPPPVCEIRNLERRVSQILSGNLGCTETSNYSFYSAKDIESMGEAFDLKDHLEVEKPISKEAPYLRQTLLPGILKNISKNSTLFDKISIFEIGTVFSNNKKGAKESPKGGHLPEQKLHVASCLYEKNNKSPYHEILSAYTSLFENLGYSYEIKKPSSGKSFLHPKRQSEIHVHGQRVAFVGELHPAIAKNFGIDERVAVAKTNLSKLVTLTPSKKSYSQISEFPSALRDIAFVVSEDESHGEIKKTLLKSSKLISSAELFDIYRGKNVGEGKKSMAFHLTYQSSNHTLEQSEVEKAHVELTSSLEKKHHAVIR